MVQVKKKVVAMIVALKSVWVNAALMPAFIVHYKCVCSASLNAFVRLSSDY
jgi:hypothetical protein